MVLVTWIKTIAFQGWCGSKGRERSNCYNKDEAVDPVCRLVSDWIQGIFISSIILIILIKDHVWHQADEKKAGWHQLSAANSGSWGRSCQGCQVATFTIMEILAIVTVVIIKCQSYHHLSFPWLTGRSVCCRTQLPLPRLGQGEHWTLLFTEWKHFTKFVQKKWNFLGLITSLIWCMPRGHSSIGEHDMIIVTSVAITAMTGMLARAWRRASFLRRVKTWPPLRRIMKRWMISDLLIRDKRSFKPGGHGHCWGG